MKSGQIWSEDFGCYVSKSFVTADITSTRSIKIDITKCKIIITPEGYYDLVMNDKKIKRITLVEFLKYKVHVIEIINKCEEYDLAVVS